MTKRYFIKTYGCQANKADSERIDGCYERRGWRKAKNIEDADEVVINTCSVRQSAEDRVFGLVRKLRDLRGVTPVKGLPLKKRIIVMGCMLYHPLKWLKEKMPQVDEFKRKEDYLSKVKTAIRSSKANAWVPIMEGCSHYCTYCVVPYARGREVSRPFEEIVCEVKELARRGYKEITLLGQNVNSYGKDLKNSKLKTQMSKLFRLHRESSTKSGQLKTQNFKQFRSPFAVLLAVLHRISGMQKISFVTSNPWDLSDDIIEAMTLPKIDRYLHLPVQSGDDEILRRMNRPYTAEQYLKLIEKIRQKIPDNKIGTDIIVGFPGETKKQFENTVKLCKKVGFFKAYIAMYSPRPGTAAYKLKDNIPFKEKRKRWRFLDELINRKPFTLMRSNL